MTYIIPAVVLATVVIAGVLIGTKFKKETPRNSPQITTKENPFMGLRTLALNMTPEKLGISLPGDNIIVYGLVMDWELGDGTMTLAAYQTGDASIYLSSGGGYIGGGKHDNVNKAAKALVLKCQNYIKKSSKSNATFLPEKDCVRFSLLTNQGIFTSQEHMKKMEDQSSPWFPLFEEANKVITEYHLVSNL